MISGGTPAEIRGGRDEVPPSQSRGDRGVANIQDQSPSTALLLPSMQYPAGV